MTSVLTPLSFLCGCEPTTTTMSVATITRVDQTVSLIFKLNEFFCSCCRLKKNFFPKVCLVFVNVLPRSQANTKTCIKGRNIKTRFSWSKNIKIFFFFFLLLPLLRTKNIKSVVWEQPDSSKVQNILLQNDYFAGFSFFNTCENERAREGRERERVRVCACFACMQVVRERGSHFFSSLATCDSVSRVSLTLPPSPSLFLSLSLSARTPTLFLTHFFFSWALLPKVLNTFLVEPEWTYLTKIKMVGQNSTGWKKCFRPIFKIFTQQQNKRNSFSLIMLSWIVGWCRCSHFY